MTKHHHLKLNILLVIEQTSHIWQVMKYDLLRCILVRIKQTCFCHQGIKCVCRLLIVLWDFICNHLLHLEEVCTTTYNIIKMFSRFLWLVRVATVRNLTCSMKTFFSSDILHPWRRHLVYMTSCRGCSFIERKVARFPNGRRAYKKIKKEK